MTKVPEPHIGSARGTEPSQPRSCRIPAARVSRRGAWDSFQAVAPPVEQLSGAVGGKEAEVLLETGQDKLRGSVCRNSRMAQGAADCLGHRGGDAAGVAEAGAPADGTDLHPGAGAKELAPGKAHRLAKELGEIVGPDLPHPNHYPPGAAQPEVGAVEFVQTAVELHPPRRRADTGHAQGRQFSGAHALKPRGGDGEKFFQWSFHEWIPGRWEDREMGR